MVDYRELHELATGVLQETLHGPVTLETVAKLAAGVLSLGDQCSRQEAVFEELIVDRYVLSELRDFWRTRYRACRP